MSPSTSGGQLCFGCSLMRNSRTRTPPSYSFFSSGLWPHPPSHCVWKRQALSNDSQLWDGKVGHDPLSPSILILSSPPPLLLLPLSLFLFCLLRKQKAFYGDPVEFLCDQSGLWLTQDLFFSVIIIFSASISCSFLPAFVLVEMETLISPVWRSFASWTC